MKNNYVSVGKILNFHGILGEAKVGFSKGQEDFIKSLKAVFLRRDDVYAPYKIEKIRFNKQFAIIKFDGINSINEISEYKNCLMFVEKNEVREALGEDEFLIDELVGLNIVDSNGAKLGVVVGVSNNGATDLLSVKSLSQQICLVPFVKAIVPEVSIKTRKITVNNIEGLIE